MPSRNKKKAANAADYNDAKQYMEEIIQSNPDIQEAVVKDSSGRSFVSICDFMILFILPGHIPGKFAKDMQEAMQKVVDEVGYDAAVAQWKKEELDHHKSDIWTNEQSFLAHVVDEIQRGGGKK